MMVSKRLEEDARFALVITGNGPWEYRVLSAVAPKLDGRVLLWFPPPLGRTGLSVLHEALKVHIDEAYKARPDIRGRPIYVLILIDKEHFSNPEKSLEELKESLVGIEVLNSRVIGGIKGAFRLDCQYGPKLFTAFIAIQGVEKCLNEQLAILLKRFYGMEVEADQSQIRNALRKMNKKIEDVVAERSLRELEELFPSLIATLKALESALAGSRSS